MFRNLEAEISRARLSRTELARGIGITPDSFTNKRYGRTEFTLSEIRILKQLFFPNCTIEYLFEELKENKSA